MLTDAELLDELKRRYGPNNVGEKIEERAGWRYVRIKNLPVLYEQAYDEVAGQGAYQEGLRRQQE